MKDESSLKMNHVDHIPQTLASHSRVPAETHTHSQHGADMLQPDPRDTFFNSEPLCVYSDPLSIPILFDSSASLSVFLLMSTDIYLFFPFCISCMINNKVITPILNVFFLIYTL